MADWAPTPAGIWTPQQSAAVTRNYIKAYRNTPVSHLKLGEQFYPEWHEAAGVIGSLRGQSVAHGAAVLAHLSPSNEAETNRIQALQMASTLDDSALANLVKAGEHQSLAQSAGLRATRSKDLSSSERKDYADAAEYHASEKARLKDAAGIKGTPLGRLGSRELGNAAAVLLGHHDDDPLASLGSAKIFDFGGLIHDPYGYSRAPIDTHYHDAGVSRTDIPYKAARGLEASGRYENFQRSHASARNIVSEMLGVDISHGAFMGGIWYGHQQRKVNTNPDARQSRLSKETDLARVTSNPAFSHFMPEAFGLAPSFGKIDIGR